MIQCHLLDGKFEEQSFKDFNDIFKNVEDNREMLFNLEIDILIEFLNKLGKKIIQDADINTIEGITYISLWLRKDNLKKICKLNYFDQEYLENFKKIDKKFELCAQPRGVVCHWIAANIPTLAFFSLIQSILSKNGSVVKVPHQNKEIILSILRILRDIEIDFEGKRYYGIDIVKSVSIVSFNSKNYDDSKNFSLIADCRIVWGGYEAVEAIKLLPQKEHCETIVFGPKYSFGVFDREFIESDFFNDALEKSVLDVAIFNQMACSSPHVFYFEKNKYSLKEISETIKSYFEKLPDKYIDQITPQGTAGKIINSRAIYLLEDNKDILKSDDISWTILIDHSTSLEEPIQGKCVFIKEIDNIEDVLYLITRKIQAMSVCVLDPEKRKGFARKATYKGVDRIVVPGKMHDFDSPWDGILTLNRLVRWVILKR